DRRTLGFSRRKHQAFLHGDATMSGFPLHAGDQRVGYAYVNAIGHIGPVAVARPDVMGAAFATALSLAAKSGAPRMSFPMVLVPEHDFGDWTHYLPRNLGFT